MSPAQNTAEIQISKTQRDKAQDIAKGLSILLVLQIHIVNAPQWFLIVDAIICSWLMPFFFTLSGYYYKPGKKSIKESIVHRTKQLLIPYFEYSIVIWVITTVYNLIQHTYTLVECLYHYLTFLVSRNFLVLTLAQQEVSFLYRWEMNCGKGTIAYY